MIHIFPSIRRVRLRFHIHRAQAGNIEQYNVEGLRTEGVEELCSAGKELNVILRKKYFEYWGVIGLIFDDGAP